MRFHYYGEPYDLGYFAETPEVGYYGQPVEGYYGEAPDFAYYGESPEFAGYGLAAPYYGEVEPGYGETEPVGYYAEEFPVGYYGEDPYAVSEYEPMAAYGEMPEMVGYGYADADGYGEQEFAEEYPGVAGYDETEMGGYVRDVPPAFNAGCPMPTNTGVGEAEPFAGYTRPTEVSPSCPSFTPQPESSGSIPDTLRPLW